MNRLVWDCSRHWFLSKEGCRPWPRKAARPLTDTQTEAGQVVVPAKAIQSVYLDTVDDPLGDLDLCRPGEDDRQFM